MHFSDQAHSKTRTRAVQARVLVEHRATAYASTRLREEVGGRIYFRRGQTLRPNASSIRSLVRSLFLWLDRLYSHSSHSAHTGVFIRVVYSSAGQRDRKTTEMPSSKSLNESHFRIGAASHVCCNARSCYPIFRASSLRLGYRCD